MDSLGLADRVLFLDDSGIYEEPEWVRERVDYVGPSRILLQTERPPSSESGTGNCC